MSRAAEPLLESDEADVDYWRHERDDWRYELDATNRGLRDLKRLRERARTDPESAEEEANDLLRIGEVELVPDERGELPSDAELVAGYYSKLIADYERRNLEAQRNTWAAERRWRTLSQAPAPRSLQARRLCLDGTRPRARESRPTRRARRGAALGDRPRPSSSDDDPEPEPVGRADEAAA